MTTTKYCMDCDYYIPGGGEYNCKADLKFYHRSVSSLKPACDLFVEKDKTEVVFSKLEIKRKPVQRRRK